MRLDYFAGSFPCINVVAGRLVREFGTITHCFGVSYMFKHANRQRRHRRRRRCPYPGSFSRVASSGSWEGPRPRHLAVAVPGTVLFLISAVHGPWGDLLHPPVLFIGHRAAEGRGVGAEVRQCTGECVKINAVCLFFLIIELRVLSRSSRKGRFSLGWSKPRGGKYVNILNSNNGVYGIRPVW